MSIDLGENGMSRELITLGEAMIVFIAENEGELQRLNIFQKELLVQN